MVERWHPIAHPPWAFGLKEAWFGFKDCYGDGILTTHQLSELLPIGYDGGESILLNVGTDFGAVYQLEAFGDRYPEYRPVRKASSLSEVLTGLYYEEADWEESTQPFAAAERGDGALLEEATDETLHTATERGDTLLHIAASSAQPEAVRYLVKRGLDVNALGYGHKTPLILATGRCSIDTVTSLLEAGANVDQSDNEGWTALHWCSCRVTDLRIVSALLNAGASVGAKNCKGQTTIDTCEIGSCESDDWHRQWMKPLLVEHLRTLR
jgi:hypothetical protein